MHDGAGVCRAIEAEIKAILEEKRKQEEYKRMRKEVRVIIHHCVIRWGQLVAAESGRPVSPKPESQAEMTTNSE